jgi:hypothetical protein
MSYFYADGKNKAEDRLITSYGKQAQAEKYRPDAKITEGERFLNIAADGTGSIGNEGELLLRSLLVRKGTQAEMTGPFVIYGRTNGKWSRTEFRYGTYAAANTAMKGALITMYEAVAVVETEDDEQRVVSTAEEESI